MPGGGPIFLRALPLDDELGFERKTQFAKSLAQPWSRRLDICDDLAVNRFVSAADVDGDGLTDLVTASLADPDPDGLTLFRQTPSGDLRLLRRLVGSGSVPLEGPRSLVVVDLDRNGAPDIVSANPESQNLTVFRRNSLDGFDAAFELTDDESESVIPQSVAAADMDGNGEIDLVSANSSREGGGIDLGSFSIFHNDGEGFLPGPHGGLNGFPTSVAAADLNDDGLTDLAVTTVGNLRRLALLVQTSQAVFELRSILQAENPPNFVVAADLDDDGHTDLVISNNTHLIVFTDLKGFLDDPKTPPTEDALRGLVVQSPSSVAVADLDRNGSLDVVSANSGSETLTAFFQYRPGVFPSPTSPRSPTELTTGPLPTSVLASDLDGDGDMDLVSANEGASCTGTGTALDTDLNVFLQAGVGTFQREPTLVRDPTMRNPTSTTVGDLDGDGDLDLVAATTNPDLLSVFRQSAPSTYTFDSVQVGPAGPQWLQAADLDDDGDLDLASANRGKDLALFYQTTLPLDPSLGFGAPVYLGGLGNPVHLLTVDLDRDGHLDLVCTDRDEEELVIYFQKAGIFGPRCGMSGPMMDAPGASAATDVDGDGDVDLVCANSGGNSLLVWHMECGGSPPGELEQRYSTWSDRPIVVHEIRHAYLLSPTALVAQDLDGDGDGDLASANPAADVLTVFLSVAERWKPLVLTGEGGDLDGPTLLAATDVNGDGGLDLVAACEGSDSLAIFLQLLPRRFTQRPILAGGVAGLTPNPRSLLAGDLDGDGEVDLVSASPDLRAITLYWGGR